MKRFLSLALVLCLILALSSGVEATGGKQYDYSTTANSGKRHELCTSLLGTRADTYYTGDYTYDRLSDLTGDQLLEALRVLMTTTHTKETSYGECRDYAVKTDCENGDGKTISLLYTSYSATRSDYINDRSGGWNREHVWPQSLGDFGTKGAGADLHHIRPSDSGVNSTRGNKLYGEVTGGKAVSGAAYTGNALGGYSGNPYFEPVDEVKGDIARICLYVYARYHTEYSKCSQITTVFESVDVLLDWCQLDPVDTWEMGRNEVVAKIQGNRNVFIDYPELAWLLFDREIPADMVTPSGEAAATVSCSHSHTKIRNAQEADCTNSGYTGDTYCSDCGEKLSGGSSIPALGHVDTNADLSCDSCGEALACTHPEAEVQNALDATCGTDGYTGDSCCKVCGEVLEAGAPIPATGQHSFGDWVTTLEATTEAAGLEERVCGTCGHKEARELPKLEPAPTEPSTEATEPSSATQPPQTTEPGAASQEEPKDDYRWLVCTVIGAGAIASIVIVLIQTKRKK